MTIGEWMERAYVISSTQPRRFADVSVQVAETHRLKVGKYEGSVRQATVFVRAAGTQGSSDVPAGDVTVDQNGIVLGYQPETNTVYWIAMPLLEALT